MTRLWFAAILFLLCGCAGWAAEKPALAIINRSGDHAAADLLFGKLSAGGDFVLVEREHLAEILHEQQLSTLSPESNVRTGKLLGADALLFVDSDGALLHLRLAETNHGERIFDEAFPIVRPDWPAVLETVRDRLALLAARLQTPPHDRLYVALSPIATARSTSAFGETLATLSTLIGVRLAHQDRILVVEREGLASIAAEQIVTGKSAADLVQANAIVRSRLVDGDAAKLQMEFQVQRSASGAATAFPMTVDRRHLAEAAEQISAKIGEILGIVALPANAAAEAPRQYRHGVILLHAEFFEPALQSLETACLLDPTNETYARGYLEGVAACIEHANYRIKGAAGISSADYLLYTDRLRSAMAVASLHPPAVSAPLAQSNGLCTFLAAHNSKLDADTLAQVAACRTELREFYERFADSDKSGLKFLGDNCPVFFEEPRAAFAYLKNLVEVRHYSWQRLREHLYPYVTYWDQPLAKQLWNDYLDDLQRKPALEAQFSALTGRCYLQGAYPGAYADSAQAEVRSAVQQLFTWLTEKDEHLQWMLGREKPRSFSNLWYALHALSVADQDRYYETVMLKVLSQGKDSEPAAFDYLSARYRHNPTTAPQIRKLLGEALTCLAGTNPPLYRETLADLADGSALAALLDPVPKLGSVLPEVPGGILLYDSAKEDPVGRNYDCGAGLVEGDTLWLASLQEKAMVITRVQISQRTSETFLFPVEGTPNPNSTQLVLSRSPTHLFVADQYHVIAVPVAPQAPFLDAKHYEIAGPKLGNDDTGGTHERAMQHADDAHFRRITAAIPAGNAVYIGVEQRTSNNGGRSSGLYRWQPGNAGFELICASDSLKPGRLNDCLPYSIIGGCAAPGGEAVYFVLAEVPYQPRNPAEGQRRGIWKFTPSTGAWERASIARLGDDLERPRFRSPTLLDIPGRNPAYDHLSHYLFDLGTQQVQHAVGAVSGGDPNRGWYAAYETESGVSYHRLYRMDGRQKHRVLSLLEREYGFCTLLPTDSGLIVLLSGQISDDNKPTGRGLAYLLPQEK